jgi:hypothetical protein
MMWHWRHRHWPRDKRDDTYRAAAGTYLEKNSGLNQTEMDFFYRKLGMRSVPSPTESDLLQRLDKGPVIFTSMSKRAGHAMMALYYDDRLLSYRIVNPCGVQAVNFDDEGDSAAPCTATSVSLPAHTIVGELGQFIWYWP